MDRPEDKMKKLALVPFFLVIFISLLWVTPVSADGIIIPDPPVCDPGPCPIPPRPRMMQLAIKYHHVDVKIEDQIAVTHVDQVFYNPNDYDVEGTYTFPLPKGAAVTGFTLWVDGQPVEGQILDAGAARNKYEEIVRSLRDPALLEYADRGAVQAHIYPIPSNGERRIELQYTQTLTAENGLVSYQYPLNTEKFSVQPLESVSIHVSISSSLPVQSVYSPTHSLNVSRKDLKHLTAVYQAENITPDADFSLYYSLGETEALHLMTYRDPSDPENPDGFFLLMLAPKPETGSDTIAKDVILVLDHSGSMDGEKFRQAQTAVHTILSHLNADDRFFLEAFNDSVQIYNPKMALVAESTQAAAWVDQISAEGSTDINRALLQAASVVDVERPVYLIFLTDGLPTVGEMNTQTILTNFSAKSRENIRLFPFGVGYDVDTVLLDTLSQQNHGASTYVRPGDDLDESLTSFYSKISSPVMTDLKLDFGTMSVYDLYPNPLPDLFSGSQITLVGRYRSGGSADMRLSGTVKGTSQTFTYSGQVFSTDSRTETDNLTVLPRLWATRKIGYLLNKVSLNGPDQETIRQIVTLSIRYGIVTPYTSYLVTEAKPLGEEEQDRIAEEQFNKLQAQPTPAASGMGAVNRAADAGAMQSAAAPSTVMATPASEDGGGTTAIEQNAVRVVGSRTFTQIDGVWTDTAFDPDRMQTLKVIFLSDEYFSLTRSSADLAEAFALGERVIVVMAGKAYEVVI
jgi:Ca-activated chloride channel family protein